MHKGFRWERQREGSHWEDGRWEDDIKIDLREVEWGCMDWIDLAQDRGQWLVLVNIVIKLRIP
jgi:hypothetical protein